MHRNSVFESEKKIDRGRVKLFLEIARAVWQIKPIMGVIGDVECRDLEWQIK